MPGHSRCCCRARWVLPGPRPPRHVWLCRKPDRPPVQPPAAHWERRAAPRCQARGFSLNSLLLRPCLAGKLRQWGPRDIRPRRTHVPKAGGPARQRGSPLGPG